MASDEEDFMGSDEDEDEDDLGFPDLAPPPRMPRSASAAALPVLRRGHALLFGERGARRADDSSQSL